MTDNTTLTEEDLMNLSDEELMAMQSPEAPVVEAEDPSPAEPEETGSDDDDTPVQAEAEDAGEDPAGDEADDVADAPENTGETKGVVGSDESDTDQGDEKPAVEAKADEPVNYEDLYKKMMAPFKANGRTFTPNSPEEAIQLMQMGANYTKKMQALQPSMKVVRMLDKNGLLDEDKISFLIDLDKKNPAAVAKLLKDAKIDPMDVDTSDEVANYKPGNHKVSDAEMSFNEQLDNVAQTPTGKETIRVINDTWDQASKSAIFKEPTVLSMINEQRANGLYATITAEIERQRVLGRMTNIPFIEAYKQAGMELQQKGLLSPAPSSPGQGNTGDAVAAEATPRREIRPSKQKTVVNGAAARRVSPAPGSGKATAKPVLDPFDLTDEQIMALDSLKV